MCHDKLEEAIALINISLSAVQKEFDIYQKKCFKPRPSEFFCLELNGEAGELANIEKKSWKGRDIPPEQFDDEAADVLIALMNYCNAKGIDIGSAVKLKLEKIEIKRKSMDNIGGEF